MPMVVVIALVKFPKVELREDEKIDTKSGFRTLLANRYVWLYFLGIFAYVGTEQGIANWTSKFLQMNHGVDPATTGAVIISRFWGLLTIGCILGLVVLKLFDSRKVWRLPQSSRWSRLVSPCLVRSTSHWSVSH